VPSYWLEKRLRKAGVAPGSFRVQLQPLSNTAELASEGFQHFFLKVTEVCSKVDLHEQCWLPLL